MPIIKSKMEIQHIEIGQLSEIPADDECALEDSQRVVIREESSLYYQKNGIIATEKPNYRNKSIVLFVIVITYISIHLRFKTL